MSMRDKKEESDCERDREWEGERWKEREEGWRFESRLMIS